MSLIFPHFIFPPVFLRPTLEFKLANLLINASVQEISFRFGHVLVLPAHFRKVSEALRNGKLSISYDPVGLAAEGSLAEYDSGSNSFKFQNDSVLDTHLGCAVAIHEASHAVADLIKGTTAIRHEEGAAHICEAWYLLNVGTDPSTELPADVVAAARAMRQRAAQSRPARASSSEINSVRRDMARSGYENAFYANDGI